jgi:hypothetical protein
LLPLTRGSSVTRPARGSYLRDKPKIAFLLANLGLSSAFGVKANALQSEYKRCFDLSRFQYKVLAGIRCEDSELLLNRNGIQNDSKIFETSRFT